MNQNKQIISVIFLITFISSGCNFMDTLYETTPECSESNLYGCSVKGPYIELTFPNIMVKLEIGAQKVLDSVKNSNYCTLALGIEPKDSISINESKIFIIDNENTLFYPSSAKNDLDSLLIIKANKLYKNWINFSTSDKLIHFPIRVHIGKIYDYKIKKDYYIEDVKFK